MIAAGWKLAAECLAWCVGAAWLWRASEMVRKLPDVVDLTGLEWEGAADVGPSLLVVVPAKDEGETLRASLETLAAQEYKSLHVIVVDDRSTDTTGAIAAEFALRDPARFEALRIDELEDGWLGKTFAMEMATRQTQSEYVLYTDADILFSPSILCRAMAYAVEADADHLVVLPTPLVKARGEGMTLGFLQVLGMWASRPWRVSDAKSRRDVAGVGAFNLVRREAFEEIGGWAPQRLVVLEDVTLGRRMKAAGKRQRIAFAPGLVLVHWAAGMRGVVKVMTKNLFSAVNFRPVMMVGACVWITVFCLGPLAGLFWFRTMIPSFFALVSIAACYRELGDVSLIDARYGWLYPVGAVAMMAAMMRSMAVVLWQRGVIWRGTHYPLRELRQHNSPFQWENAAEALRDEARRQRPSRLRRWVDAKGGKKTRTQIPFGKDKPDKDRDAN